MIIIDPETRQRIVVDQFVGDIIYDKKGDSAIAQENKVVVGPWKDFTGSRLGLTSRNIMINPLPNQFDGTDEGIEGNRLGNLNITGENANIYRRRTKQVFRKLNKRENSVSVNKD